VSADWHTTLRIAVIGATIAAIGWAASYSDAARFQSRQIACETGSSHGR